MDNVFHARINPKRKKRIKEEIMNRVAKFDKVSFEQFWSDYIDIFSEFSTELHKIEMIKDIYNKIELPTRATQGSAGYDFKSPMDIELKPGETIKIPTGIRCRIEDGWVLKLYPRSSFGFKYRLQLDNTVGIIDSDYYGSNNEGHIMVKITNDSNEGKVFKVNRGQGFVQGIFVPYGITVDDNVDDIRNGGFGSTER